MATTEAEALRPPAPSPGLLLPNTRRCGLTLPEPWPIGPRVSSAFSCTVHHEPSRAYYLRKRAEGKAHHQAVIALARRRVNVLWAMLRDGKLYREPNPEAA